ncbi:MAG: co-chaperone GroES [Terriglobia bacterium]
MKFRPLRDRIVVRRLDARDRGRVASSSIQLRKNPGKSCSCRRKRQDPGKRTWTTVKPRNHITGTKYSGSEVKIDGEEYLIMREDEVLAITEAAAASRK